jgi:curved DNA-binding protein
MSSYPLTLAQARAVLGLSAEANSQDVLGAFRAAAKLAHPDRPGGDAARFRDVLEAYRLLQAAAQLPAVIPTRYEFEAYVEIGPLLALTGGEADAVMEYGRRQRLRIPAGARHGDKLEFVGAKVQVRVTVETKVQLRGSDLWVTAEAPSYLLEEGGRAALETPLGRRVVWISRKAAERRLIRLEGQGLPARGPHPQGSLFIRLAPDAGAPESPARAQLKKFAAAWAA